MRVVGTALLLVSGAGAFELGASLSRRDIARALAIAPAAVATAAFADGNNVYLGFSKAGLGSGNVDTYGAPTKAVGSPPSVDAAGAKVPATALRSSAADYAFKSTRPGEKERTPAQQAAFERLLAK